MKKYLATTALWILLLPYAFILVGAASNQLVLIANHDTFPVLMNNHISPKAMPEGFDDDGHVLMTSETHLNALADIFDFHDSWKSIGDLLLECGDWMQSFCPYIWVGVVLAKLSRKSSYERTV